MCGIIDHRAKSQELPEKSVGYFKGIMRQRSAHA
jgi:hypothetical protein